jgi:integrase
MLSGARINETCQLHLEELREVDGVWVFDINDKGDKRLKTFSSKQLIPIPSQLLLAYVKRLRAKEETRLFPTLKKHRGRYSHTASR